MDIDFTNLDQETLLAVLPELPAFAKDVSAYIGIPSTLAMVDALGGMEFRFGGPKSEGFRRLSTVIGEAAAQRLGDLFGKEDSVYIPRCANALRVIRNRQITEDYCQLLIAKNSARVAASEIAIRYRMSNRAVEAIVNGKTGKGRKGEK